MKSILFVCLGNICRSPTAHGIFQSMLDEEGFSSFIKVDSAGTSAYHVGSMPDQRMMRTAKQHDYDLSFIRSRQVEKSDFNNFDQILAMDTSNLEYLQNMCPEGHLAKVKLFLSYCPEIKRMSVPDPYYGGQEGFDDVVQLIELGCKNLLMSLK